MYRRPAVAGYFYPASRDELASMIQEYLQGGVKERKEVKAVISPHAGYIYSGPVAGAVYGSIEPPEVAVIVGPNHTGFGERAAIMSRGSWVTPLGEVKIAEDLADAIKGRSEVLEEDFKAHASEHSLEVQVPFLQFLNPKVKIVPIVLFPLGTEEIADIAKSISESVKDYNRKTLLVASTDMSHYVPQDVVASLDKIAIDKIVELDGYGLIEVVKEKNISMCGYIPTAVVIEAAKLLGAKKGELIAYSTSGEISGDPIVVGYAGVIIY